MKQDERRFQRNVDSIARSLETLVLEVRYIREMIEEVIIHAQPEPPEEPPGDDRA